MGSLKIFLRTINGRLVVFLLFFSVALMSLAIAFPGPFNKATGGVCAGIIPGGKISTEDVILGFFNLEEAEIEYIPPVAAERLQSRVVVKGDALEISIKLKDVNFYGYQGDIGFREIIYSGKDYIKPEGSDPKRMREVLTRLFFKRVNPKMMAFLKTNLPYSYIFEVLEGKRWLRMNVPKDQAQYVKFTDQDTRRLARILSQAVEIKRETRMKCCVNLELSLSKSGLLKALQDFKDDPLSEKFAKKFKRTPTEFKSSLGAAIEMVKREPKESIEAFRVVAKIRRVWGKVVPVSLRGYMVINQQIATSMRKELASTQIEELEKQLGKELASEIIIYFNDAVSQGKLDFGELRIKVSRDLPSITPPTPYVDLEEIIGSLP